MIKRNYGTRSISHWGLFPSWLPWDYEGTPWFYAPPEIERTFTFVGDFE